MSADDWLSLAMADTHLVAELLLRLRLPLPPSKRSRPSPPQSWTIHQRRFPIDHSTLVDMQAFPTQISSAVWSSDSPPPLTELPFRFHFHLQIEDDFRQKIDRPPTFSRHRFSPSSPWPHSLFHLSQIAKYPSHGEKGSMGLGVEVLGEGMGIGMIVVTPPGETTPTKRPRKKKTLAALKEEESLLMEEQKHLKMCGFLELDIQVEPQLERQERNNHFEAVKERKDKLVLPDLNDPAGEDVTMSY
ncbi:hypothetical protein Ccrd_015595 [Cynara cardunculus var. scolymus]|uniref:Uncharacterized protein n=1 Tax=Cynara cardunculus var. scolymus TaxID=59895 RepID=A0A103YBK0_CYNCS|nr:hypothetical protein Ccrd_015595 [Cynara cardunculus var. scolymus]